MPKWFGIVFLNVHKCSQENYILNEISLFLSSFQSMCEYGIVLITSGVLTPFLPFPKILGSGRWRAFEGDIVEGLDSLFHPNGVGPELSRAMSWCRLQICYELNDSFISFFTIEYYIFVWPTYGLVRLM